MNSGHPSCYQMHYGQRKPHEAGGPLLHAVRGLNKDTRSHIPVAKEVSDKQCPLNNGKCSRGTESGQCSGRPAFVEPLALPSSDDKKLKEEARAKPLAERNSSIHASRSKVETASKPASHEGNCVERKMKKVVGNGRVPPSLKRLCQSDRQCSGLAKGMFETEYRRHYRNWIGEKWAAGGHGRREEEDKSTGE